MRRAVLLALAASALALSACGKTPSNDEVFGDRVRAYLLKHPEVLIEVQQKLQEKQVAAMKTVAAEAVRANRAAIERDPRDFVANPDGKVTITEFYDYRCPHCVNVAPQVLELIKANPDIRFVFKELPIFGEPSQKAARAALAVKRAGGDYLSAYHDLMMARPLDDAALNRILAKYGAPSPETGETRKELDAHLADTQMLASRIGLQGTPYFVVGETVIEGENLPALTEAIEAARKKK